MLDSIKGHVPKPIPSCSSSIKRIRLARQSKFSTKPNTQSSLASDLAIEIYLLQNIVRSQHYDDSRFSLLAQGRSLLIYLLLKPLSFKKLLTPPYATKKNICAQLKYCALMTLSNWSLSSQSRLGLFL